MIKSLIEIVLEIKIYGFMDPSIINKFHVLRIGVASEKSLFETAYTKPRVYRHSSIVDFYHVYVDTNSQARARVSFDTRLVHHFSVIPGISIRFFFRKRKKKKDAISLKKVSLCLSLHLRVNS